MKRKKLYSMLALGMAMTLAAGMPVSAAVSPDTGNTDFPVTDEDTVIKDDNQEVTVGKDETGAVVQVQIEATVDSKDAIKDFKESQTSVTTQQEKVDVETTEEMKVPAAIEDEEQRTVLNGESKSQFSKIKADDIKVDKAGLQITVTPVRAEVQSVVWKAVEQIAKQFNLNVQDKDTNLLASADISIPNIGDEPVNVTIPLNGETPDTSKYDYRVLHYNEETQTWETLPSVVTADGIVVATFSSTSPVFVVKAEKVQSAADDNNDNNDNNDDNGGESGSGSSSKDSGSSSADNAKAAPAPVVNEPVNPAVSPKTGE